MDALLFLKIVIPFFFAILFLQSGLDKVFDWKGNLAFHKQHFANSPLKHFSTLNLGLMAVLEVICGILSAFGAVVFFMNGNNIYALGGLELAGVIFTILFFGQRISKDYAGAVTIVTYFILDVLAIAIVSW